MMFMNVNLYPKEITTIHFIYLDYKYENPNYLQRFITNITEVYHYDSFYRNFIIITNNTIPSELDQFIVYKFEQYNYTEDIISKFINKLLNFYVDNMEIANPTHLLNKNVPNEPKQIMNVSLDPYVESKIKHKKTHCSLCY